MQSYPFVRIILFLVCLLSLAACIPAPATAIILPTLSPTQPEATATALSPGIRVAYVQGGNIHLWESTTQQSRVIVNSGDVADLTISDDGQVIAFQRRVIFPEPLLRSESSLWAIQQDGTNERQLVSGDVFRQRLNPAEGEDLGIAEMTWIPGTHRLIYSGTKGNAAATDIRNAEDVYLVDADTLTDLFLAPAGTGVRVSGLHDGKQFLPSPDGSQIALLSGMEITFVNADGSNLRPAVLAYTTSGAGDVPFVPTGVWTQDGRALLVNALVNSSPEQGVHYAITRVPADGTPADEIASIANSFPASVAFSPHGNLLSFRSNIEPAWAILPITAELGPLDTPTEYGFDAVRPFWSPTGEAYVFDQGKLQRLCPNSSNFGDPCGDVINVAAFVTRVQWLDNNRFLYLTREPNGLFLGSLDGTSLPIVSWPPEEYIPRFHAAVLP